MAEGTRLESAHTRKGIGGSNPSLSAIIPSEENSKKRAQRCARVPPPTEFCTILHVNSEPGVENTVVRRINDPPRKRTYLNGYRGFNSASGLLRFSLVDCSPAKLYSSDN